MSVAAALSEGLSVVLSPLGGDSGLEKPGVWAMPALIPMEVSTHRWNGEVWIMILCLRLLSVPATFSVELFGLNGSSSVSRLRRRLAMRAPRALD